MVTRERPAWAGERSHGEWSVARPAARPATQAGGESTGDVEDWGRDEHELVRRCKEGSEAAYAVLVRLHRPRLYSLAYRLLLDRDAAEDVVQETFIAAFRQMERFEPRPSLAAWLNTIALRTAGRAAARRRARPRTSIDRPAPAGGGQNDAGETAWAGEHLAHPALVDDDPSADPLAAAESADLRRQLAAAIAELPFKYRAAVVVRHVLGLEYAEAARTLDIPLNTFKSNLLRGTKLLRETLVRELAEPAGPAGREGPGGDGEVGLPGGSPAARRPDGALRPSAVRASPVRSSAEAAQGSRGPADLPVADQSAAGRTARG